MKRIKFGRTELYESEGRNKGPTFTEGSTHDFEDHFADRWLRRGAAALVNTRERIAPDPSGPNDPAPIHRLAPEPILVPLAEHTIPQLRALAVAETIDLGDVTLKADIVSAIELAREERAKADGAGDA